MYKSEILFTNLIYFCKERTINISELFFSILYCFIMGFWCKELLSANASKNNIKSVYLYCIVRLNVSDTNVKVTKQVICKVEPY